MTYETVGGYPASPDIDLDVPEICEKCNRDCPEPCEAFKRFVAVKTWFGKYGYNPSSFECWKELEKILGVGK